MSYTPVSVSFVKCESILLGSKLAGQAGLSLDYEPFFHGSNLVSSYLISLSFSFRVE